MGLSVWVSVISAVVAVIAAAVTAWQLCLMLKYRREDAAAAEQRREQEAATLRSNSRLQFEAFSRQIPNVAVAPPAQVVWVAFSKDQMQPVGSIGESLNRLVVLPPHIQQAVRDAHEACTKLGPPYTTTTPSREAVLEDKDTVAAVLKLL